MKHALRSRVIFCVHPSLFTELYKTGVYLLKSWEERENLSFYLWDDVIEEFHSRGITNNYITDGTWTGTIILDQSGPGSNVKTGASPSLVSYPGHPFLGGRRDLTSLQGIQLAYSKPHWRDVKFWLFSLAFNHNYSGCLLVSTMVSIQGITKKFLVKPRKELPNI